MRWKKVGWIHTTFWILIAQIFKYVIAYQKNFKAAVFPVYLSIVDYYLKCYKKIMYYIFFMEAMKTK